MKVLVSAGPTVEAIDPVRFISNRSSGKMGYAIAVASSKMGFDTTLVSGPVKMPPLKNVRTILVQSASEMASAIEKESRNSQMIIMAAAVADYTPANPADQKIKKRRKSISIRLVRTKDILASLGESRKKGQTVIGFSADTSDSIGNAIGKMRRKKIDWIVANEVGRSDRGFDSDNNAATLISKDGKRYEFPLQSKKSLAKKILRTILAGTD